MRCADIHACIHTYIQTYIHTYIHTRTEGENPEIAMRMAADKMSFMNFEKVIQQNANDAVRVFVLGSHYEFACMRLFWCGTNSR